MDKKILVATLGSAGDLHPFLAIARALHEAGITTHFASQESHRQEVETQGLPFHAIGSDHDYQRMLAHPALWHPLRGFGVLWRHLAVPSIEPTVALIENLISPSSSGSVTLTVLASPMVLGARLAREQCDFRLIHGHTAPGHLRSLQDPLFIAGRRVPSWLPRTARDWAWKWLDRNKLDPLAAPAIQRWLLSRKLTPAPNNLFAGWLFSPDEHLALFPENFGNMPTDWPVQPTFVGFPLYQAQPDLELSPALKNFLARQTEAPVTFYPGPGSNPNLTSFQQLLNQLLTKDIACVWLGKTPEINHPKFFTSPKEPLPLLLARSLALIHHGGIGTCAQGLARHIHQTILPAAFDQHDNAARVAEVQQASTNSKDLLEILAQHINSAGAAPHQTAPFNRFKYSLPNTPNLAAQKAVQAILKPR